MIPSRCDEAFSLSALEGMAAGALTIGARRGGLPEVIGTAGLLFDAELGPSLADRLLDALVSPDQLRLGGIACRHRAESFSWKDTFERLVTTMAI